MDNVQVTFTETGEVKSYKGTMMVAPNGVIFIKEGKRVVFASGSINVIVEVL